MILDVVRQSIQCVRMAAKSVMRLPQQLQAEVKGDLIRVLAMMVVMSGWN